MLGTKEIKLLGNKVTGKKLLLVTLLLVTLFLSGCVTLPDPESSQNFSAHTVATLTPGQSVGQTFVSHRERLNGIDLWLKTPESVYLTVELFHAPEESTPLFSGGVSIREGQNHISLPPQSDPRDQSYYIKLTPNQGTVEILGRNEDAYPLGSAYLDGQPLEADLAFQGTYEYGSDAILSDLRGLLSMGGILLPLGILLIIPGWLLLDFSGLKTQFDLGERVGLALGLSLAAIPVTMLWTSLVGFHWGRISIWLVIGLLLALQIWCWFRESQVASGKRQAASEQPDNLEPENALSTPPSPLTAPLSSLPAFLLLLAIFALALFVRFAMVRDLAAPAWVDSIHHGLITRSILESGGIPETYAPYLPSGADHYHLGFHTGLAAYIWLTGLEIPTAMLIFGQVLNALMVFPVYLLTHTLTKNRPASLAAALIVSAFTLMPAYYASWGRYTHLTGLLVLPTSLALTVKFLNSGHLSKQRSDPNTLSLSKGMLSAKPARFDKLSGLVPNSTWLLAALAIAGMFLIHYRVTAFWVALLLAYLLVQINPRDWPKSLLRLGVLALFSALFLLPWLPSTLINLLVPVGQKLSDGQAAFSGIPWGFLKPGLGEVTLVLAGIGLVLGIILRKRFVFTVLLWTGLMYLMANLGAIPGMPGAGYINPAAMEITLFMPLAVLGGYAIGGTLELLDKITPERGQFIPRVILVFLGAAAGIWGAQRLLPTLNPVTFLARFADFPAIHWIEQNIPEGETILVNSAEWGYGLYRGNDGGFWISALSPHPTMPPPVLYGMGTREEIEHVNQVAEAILAAGEDPAALWDLMEVENIRYVYTGVRGGVISPQALSQSDLFAVRYQQNGTWVFEAQPPNP